MSQMDGSQRGSQLGSAALGSLSSQAAHRRKYHGLLKRSPLKNLRDNLFRFMDYINTRSPTHRSIINFMKYLSFIQIFIISCLPFSDYWDQRTIVGKIVNVFSVIAFISPSHVDQDSFLIISLVVEIIVLIIEFTFVGVFIYFMRMSKCPTLFISVVNVVFCSFLIYLVTMFSSYAARSLYGLIEGVGSFSLNIVSLVLSLFHMVPVIAAQLFFVTPMIMFRPQAFHLLFSQTMMKYIACISIYTVLTSFGSLLGGLAGNIISILSCIIPVPVILIFYLSPFEVGTYSLLAHSSGLYIAVCLDTLLIASLRFANALCGDYSFIAISAIVIACIAFGNFYFNSVFKKTHIMLDQIGTEREFIETMPKLQATIFLRLAFESGFAVAHDWTIFNGLIEKYPRDRKIALIYARYAAIYPDETRHLQVAARHLISLKSGSLEIKHCIFQIYSILQQRDSSMSTTIKKNLGKTNQKIEKARGQIRYLWECIMRGNVDELEGLATHLKSLEEEIVRDYSQLCLVYPNNPYVAHAYSLFLREIMNDENMSMEMQNVYQILRQGKRTREERCYFFAQRLFTSLPTEEQHSALSRGEKKVHVQAIEQSMIEQSSNRESNQTDTFNPNQQFINEEKLQRRYVESMVESVRLPSMRYGPFAVVFLCVILMPVCIIPITVSVVADIDNVRNAMRVVMYSSQLRMTLAEMILLAYQTVFHNTKVSRMISLKERWERTYGDSRQLPKNWTTDSEALRQSIQDNRALVEMVNSIAHDLAQSGFFNDALDLLYTPKVEFSSYQSHNSYTIGNFSLEYIVTYMIGIAVKSADTDDPIGFLDDFEFWTMIKNVKQMLPHFEMFASYVVEGIIALTLRARNQVMVNVLSAVVIPYIATMVFLIFLIIKLDNEKSSIFSVFKALPKSALSAIVTQLNSQNRHNTSDENQVQVVSNAQEENALRVLSTSVDTNSGRLDRLWPIIALIVIFSIASVAVIVILIIFSFQIGDKFDLINPLFGAVPYVQSQFCAISMGILRLSAAAEFKDCEPNCPLTLNAKANYTLVNNDLEDLLSQIVYSINLVRVGSEESNSFGLSVGGESLITLLTNDMCKPEDDMKRSIDSLNCLSYESGIAVIWQKIKQMHQASVLERSDLAFDLDSHNVILSWLLGVAKEQYVTKSIYELSSLADRLRNSIVNNTIIVCVAVCVTVIVLCGIFLVPQFIRLAEIARWSLRLLLFCQPNIVLQAKSIIKVLSNDFSRKEDKTEQNGANFYETVVSHLLDGVVFLNNELSILAVNTAVGTILGLSDIENIVGKKLSDILKPPKDSSSLKAFFAALQGALRAQRSPSIELEAEVMQGEENITLLLSITAVSSSGNVQIKAINAEGLSVLALVMKDMTSTIASNKLLVEEGIKSEKLLLMILPPIIVNKLQSGEKNISFAVKSASIMFVDIVSFTPWCSSNTATYVMRTLNRLFAEFDRILKKYDRMTKIKCIGDCYMCAGGIFDEINQPAEHAKQAISYGIDIISALKLLNIELNEKLRIRVGVNTGGPIVAGVLGIEKPTFDILGPDICLAAMMEHHGVPMNVHIPQHCYELVYGSMFRIKERGDVEVKGKMYHTYVVSGYDQKE